MGPDGPSPEQGQRFRSDLETLTGPEAGRLGIAFSGGPDSLALLLLAACAFPGRIEAATVDHRLRIESEAEARRAGDICARLDIPHFVLRIDAPLQGNVQAGARKARYALLEAWRDERELDWLLTAHHADDQAETLLMRLNRGAGSKGLGAIRSVNGRIVRPLLGWRRDELAAIVRRSGIEPVDDPSNRDERFDRVRLRRALEKADWIHVEGLARSAAALEAASEALRWVADRIWDERAVDTGSELRIDPRGLPAELRRRLVQRALERLTGAASPRGEALSRLIAALEAGGTRTLAGVKAKGGTSWNFSLAPPRKG